jgi:hypothetical protein
MDEWFKARLIWHDGIEALSDAEAGRLAKALWKYAATGEVTTGSGGEKFALATCLATLRKDADERTTLSEIRSRSGAQGGRPKGSKGKAKESKKSICFSEKAKESKKSICDNKNKIQDIIPLTPLPGDDDGDDLHRIQQEHDQMLDAASKAGFPATDAIIARLIDLYSEHGMDKLLAAIDCCVEHNAVNLAYLRAVLQDKPKPEDDAPYDWREDLRRRGIGV